MLLYFLPLLFVFIGLAGGFFTFTGWLGWYRQNTRNPFGRMMRGLLQFLLRPKILMSLLFTSVAGICAGLVWWSIANRNLVGIAFAGGVAWSFWRALSFRKKRGRR